MISMKTAVRAPGGALSGPAFRAAYAAGGRGRYARADGQARCTATLVFPANNQRNAIRNMLAARSRNDSWND